MGLIRGRGRDDWDPKTRAGERDVPIHRRLLPILATYNKSHPLGGLTENSLRRFFKSISIDAGVPRPLVNYWTGHEQEDEIDFHYYRPQVQAGWMAKVPFGEPSETEVSRLSLTANSEPADMTVSSAEAKPTNPTKPSPGAGET